MRSRIPGGNAPYGYRWGAFGRLEPAATEQRMLHEIGKLAAVGASLDRITDWLAKSGYRNRVGRRFARTQVERLRRVACDHTIPVGAISRLHEHDDCRLYSACLGEAARRNAKRLGCGPCHRYVPLPREESPGIGSAMGEAQDHAPGNLGLSGYGNG